MVATVYGDAPSMSAIIWLLLRDRIEFKYTPQEDSSSGAVEFDTQLNASDLHKELRREGIWNIRIKQTEK